MAREGDQLLSKPVLGSKEVKQEPRDSRQGRSKGVEAGRNRRKAGRRTVAGVKEAGQKGIRAIFKEILRKAGDEAGGGEGEKREGVIRGKRRMDQEEPGTYQSSRADSKGEQDNRPTSEHSSPTQGRKGSRIEEESRNWEALESRNTGGRQMGASCKGPGKGKQSQTLLVPGQGGKGKLKIGTLHKYFTPLVRQLQMPGSDRHRMRQIVKTEETGHIPGNTPRAG